MALQQNQTENIIAMRHSSCSQPIPTIKSLGKLMDYQSGKVANIVLVNFSSILMTASAHVFICTINIDFNINRGCSDRNAH